VRPWQRKEEDANGLIKTDRSVTDTTKEEKMREREKSTVILIDRRVVIYIYIFTEL
jgi:hypothetical protein